MGSAARGGLVYALDATADAVETSVVAPGRPPTSPSGLVFLDSSIVVHVVELTCPIQLVSTRPPHTGVALSDGRVLTVLMLANPDAPARPVSFPGADRAVLCDLSGERVAIKGGEVIASGLFPVDPAGTGILWEGESVPELDLRALHAQAEAAIWAARASASSVRSESSALPGDRKEREP